MSYAAKASCVDDVWLDGIPSGAGLGRMLCDNSCVLGDIVMK